jgi:hypothetical protein
MVKNTLKSGFGGSKPKSAGGRHRDMLTPSFPTPMFSVCNPPLSCRFVALAVI